MNTIKDELIKNNYKVIRSPEVMLSDNIIICRRTSNLDNNYFSNTGNILNNRLKKFNTNEKIEFMGLNSFSGEKFIAIKHLSLHSIIVNKELKIAIIKKARLFTNRSQYTYVGTIYDNYYGADVWCSNLSGTIKIGRPRVQSYHKLPIESLFYLASNNNIYINRILDKDTQKYYKKKIIGVLRLKLIRNL